MAIVTAPNSLAKWPSDAASSLVPGTKPQAPADLGWLSLLGQDPYSSIIAALSKIPGLAGLPGLAGKQVGAALAPALAGVTLSGALEQRQLASQAAHSGQLAQALAAMNIKAGDQIYGNYSDAAKMFGALGQGLTGATAADWGAQAQKTQAAVDQMTGGVPTYIQGYDPAMMRNTQQVANVGMPAVNLEQQALQAGALTRSAQAANVGQIVDIANQYEAKLADARYAQMIEKNKIEAQRPALVQKAIDSLKGERTTQIANLAKMVQARTGWQTDIIQLQQKQESADAYNKYLDSKSTLSQEDLEWKKKFEQGKLAIARANERTKKIAAALKAAGITGVNAEGNVMTGFWQNPKTGKVEKQPPNTFIGKDGFPHYLPGYHGDSGSTSKNNPPGTSLADFHDNMTEGLTTAWGIFAPTAFEAAQAKYHTRAEIVKYLNDNFGKAYIARYPKQAKTVQQQIKAVADAAVAWLTAHNKKAPSAGGGNVPLGPNAPGKGSVPRGKGSGTSPGAGAGGGGSSGIGIGPG